MQRLRDDFRPFEGQSVLTIGTFDGIHIGQQRLLKQVQERAAALGVKSGVVSFDPHPASMLNSEGAPVKLTSVEEKQRLIEELGLDFLVSLTFDDKMRQTAGSDFLASLCEGLRPVELWGGEDFALWHENERENNLSFMRQWAEPRGIAIQTIPLVKVDGDALAVSDSRIRALLAQGKVEQVTRLLGRPPRVRGVVVTGNQFGREINYRTANIHPDLTHALPADGGYITVTILPDGTRVASSTGVLVHHPPEGYGEYLKAFDWSGYEELKRSIPEHLAPRIETHLIDWSGDLYDQEIVIEFVMRKEAEVREPVLSAKAFVAQIHRGLAEAKAIHAKLATSNPVL
ncbi:MAG: riboflavin kinase [Ardenticatenaceae bacterium]